VLIRYEYYVAAVWLLLAVFLSRREERTCRKCRLFHRLGGRPLVDVVLVGLVAGALGALVSLTIAWPEPKIHDEFSYLLAADTFARGRLTNPTHPLSVHFETFHVNQVPTYCSVYPPGQGLVLALGQVLGGHPIVGVWASFGLACAAVCWMLQAFVPRRWAVAGGLLAATRFGFIAGEAPGYWSQSYWGGAVAMAGGAIAFGAWKRLTCQPRVSQALLLALGLAILANSRPFEGALYGLPIGAALVVSVVRRGRPHWQAAFTRVLLSLALVLGLTFCAMAFYNLRLTGNAFRLPYQQNGIMYGLVPLFLWQPLKAEPAYHHPVMRDYNVKWAMSAYLGMRSIPGYLAEIAHRLRTFVNFYIGPILLAPLFALPVVLRSRSNRFAGLVCAVLLLGLTVTTWVQPHYAAPITGLVVLLLVQGLRHLRFWRPGGRPVGAVLVRTLPIAYAILFVASLSARSEVGLRGWHLERVRLLSELQKLPGQHLVIVRYAPDHSPHEEWVYNSADIDSAKVVWARDLRTPDRQIGAGVVAPPDANNHLISYFEHRSIWFLDADERPAVLHPYQ
jgi:hypothetical protein